jgi:hypothetical protein
MVVCVNHIRLLKVVRDYFWTLIVAGDNISIAISVSSFVGLTQQGASGILGVNKALNITTIVFVAIKYQVSSVGRHQDRTKEVREIPRQEQLNVRAADLATEAINTQTRTRRVPLLTHLVQTLVYLIQGKTAFTSHEVRALRIFGLWL